MKKFDPINKKFPHIIHGGDYNPDQWLEYPHILDEDIRLIKLANCNTMTIGIFSWSTLEPKEGEYDFSFLDERLEKFKENGIYAILATPSGARPAWMSKTHPEVLRVNKDRTKNLHGARHNHCFTSPYYRKKVREINTLLAQRYKDHPALLAWHVSNEYGGECHCDLCQNAFREWLKIKYNNDLDRLNHEYWTRFWSHTYTSWDQIESPSPKGETCTHGLNLDWKRFVTYQTIDFMKNEIKPLKEITPDIPVTTNFMGTYPGLDYFKFKDIVDVVSWDNYPTWHEPAGDVVVASRTAFLHDLNRSIKGGKPFMLMESTPSCVNWAKINKLKRPNMHALSSIQAIAHGSDTVQYFQWRKGRGSSEKFHGAVVDHCGHENTRVFREVAKLGADLKSLSDIVGTYTPSQVAVIYDWENRWAIDDLQGLQNEDKAYQKTCEQHYFPFWKKGINIDVIDSDCDFSKYKLIIAPMLYMIKPGVIEKIKSFVSEGGVIVFTYVSGWVNENDLCYLGGFPAGELKDVFGIWSEEIDTLYKNEKNFILYKNKIYDAIDYCEIVHATTAKILATYQEDFYKDMPALTCNDYGKGKAYYIAFRDTGKFTEDFYAELIEELNLERVLDTELPSTVTAHSREDDDYRYIFIENYGKDKVKVSLSAGDYYNIITKETISNHIVLEPYGYVIMKSPKY